MSRRIDPAVEQRVIADYLAGQGSKAVAATNGVSAPTVTAILLRNDVEVRGGKPAPAVSDSAVLDAYRAHPSIRTVARSLGIPQPHVALVLERHGATVAPGESRVYPVRHDAFKTLDPQTAYWLGLLYADGSVNTEKRNVRLTLDYKDAPTLNRFHDFVGSPGRPLLRHGETGLCATATSREMALDLARWGIYPRKSWIDSPAPDELAAQPAFWLGLLDGDGTISQRLTAAHTDAIPTLGFLGNRLLMAQAAAWLAPHTARGGTPRHRQQRSDCEVLWGTGVTGTGAQSAIRCLMGSMPVSMERKRESARKALEWVPYAASLRAVVCERCQTRFVPPSGRGRQLYCDVACRSQEMYERKKGRRRQQRESLAG